MLRKQNFLLSFLTFSKTFYNYHRREIGEWKMDVERLSSRCNSFNAPPESIVYWDVVNRREKYRFSNIVNPFKVTVDPWKRPNPKFFIDREWVRNVIQTIRPETNLYIPNRSGLKSTNQNVNIAEKSKRNLKVVLAYGSLLTVEYLLYNFLIIKKLKINKVVHTLYSKSVTF